MKAADDMKPKQVRFACYLLWGFLALGFVSQILDAGGLSDTVALNYLIVVAVWGYLIVGIGKGRNSGQ
jgi:hypothetical protein